MVFENFITVDGTKLMDGDKELKFVSLNYPQATSDTAWESENAVKTIKAMGGNVTRSYTIPVYNGQNSATAYVTGVDENGQIRLDELKNAISIMLMAFFCAMEVIRSYKNYVAVGKEQNFLVEHCQNLR